MATDKAKKEKVAEHALVDASGAEVETEELATGVQYKLIAGGEPIVWQSGLQAGEPKTMIWCFGAKTLLTNETSQSRQKGRNSVADQLDDAMGRIKLIESGTWVDRTREGFKPDLAMLVTAFGNSLIAAGKITAEVITQSKGAEWTQRAAEDAQWVKDVYALPAVKAEYATLAGRPLKTAESLI